MADNYPKSIADLTEALAQREADVARLSASVAGLQALLVQRDTEITRLRKPKPAPRILDAGAKDKFQRPAIIR